MKGEKDRARGIFGQISGCKDLIHRFQFFIYGNPKHILKLKVRKPITRSAPHTEANKGIVQLLIKPRYNLSVFRVRYYYYYYYYYLVNFGVDADEIIRPVDACSQAEDSSTTHALASSNI